MKNKKNIYTSPSLKVLTLELGDVISTSGFDGTPQNLGGNSANSTSMNDTVDKVANTDPITFFALFNAN